MKIPKYIRKGNRRYEFVKKYPNYYLYQDVETKVKRCYSKYDLGLVKEVVAPPVSDINVEKIKI